MPDDPSAGRTAQEAVEASALERLTDPQDQRAWSVSEIARDFDDAVLVADAIAAMHADGSSIAAASSCFRPAPPSAP